MKYFILSFSVIFAMFLLLSNCTNRNSKSADKEPVEALDEMAIIEIPDANFNAYLLENFDADKDGAISLAEAKKIITIDCSGREIKSLDGIEKFENLEFLNCSNNQLFELELRYNKKLERLICINNDTPDDDLLAIYIGMSSPLRNKEIQQPLEKEEEQIFPVDINKCTLDDKIFISLSYDD